MFTFVKVKSLKKLTELLLEMKDQGAKIMTEVELLKAKVAELLAAQGILETSQVELKGRVEQHALDQALLLTESNNHLAEVSKQLADLIAAGAEGLGPLITSVEAATATTKSMVIANNSIAADVVPQPA